MNFGVSTIVPCEETCSTGPNTTGDVVPRTPGESVVKQKVLDVDGSKSTFERYYKIVIQVPWYAGSYHCSFYKCQPGHYLMTSWHPFAGETTRAPILFTAEMPVQPQIAKFPQISEFPRIVFLPECDEYQYRLTGVIMGNTKHFTAAFELNARCFDLGDWSSKIRSDFSGWVYYDGVATEVTPCASGSPPELQHGYRVDLLIYARQARKSSPTPLAAQMWKGPHQLPFRAAIYDQWRWGDFIVLGDGTQAPSWSIHQFSRFLSCCISAGVPGMIIGHNEQNSQLLIQTRVSGQTDRQYGVFCVLIPGLWFALMALFQVVGVFR